MFAVQLFSCVCYNQCWLWQRWDVSHWERWSWWVTTPDQARPLMVGVRWGHTWCHHHHHHLSQHNRHQYYAGHQSPHMATHTTAEYCWWLDIAQEASPSQSALTCVRGGRREGRGLTRQETSLLSCSASVCSKTPGRGGLCGTKYRAGENDFSHLHLCLSVSVSQCHSRYRRGDPL